MKVNRSSYVRSCFDLVKERSDQNMASSDQAGVQQLFPPPPYYFIQFVPDPDGTAERPLPPLPPPCVEGTYQMFGELHTVSPIYILTTLYPPLHSHNQHAHSNLQFINFCRRKMAYRSSKFSVCTKLTPTAISTLSNNFKPCIKSSWSTS